VIGLLFALALAGSQAAAEPAPPNSETVRMLVRWGECSGRTADELARRTTEPAEVVATAAMEACRDAEDRLQQSMRAQYGADATATQMPMIRQDGRGRIMQAIDAARGGAPVQGEGNEVLVWGRCVHSQIDELARGTATVEEIVAAARRNCAAQEQAARAAMVRDHGEERAGATMADLLRETEDIVQRRVAEIRGTRR